MSTGKPNILITGTPGVGKSTLAQRLAQITKLEWINIGKVAEEKNCYEGYDAEFQCPILDEDRVIDCLDEKLSKGGYIVDYHGCDFFPQRWFDVVFVLRANTEAIYDRLSERGYSETKLQNNVECEIFQTILEEARESYDENIVHELSSNDLQDLEKNLQKILEWINNHNFVI